MAPRALAVVLVFLLLGLPAAPASAAEPPLGVHATPAPGSNWAFVALHVPASAWQEEDGSWSLSLRLAVDGIDAEALTATEIMLDAWPFGFHPMVHPGEGGLWITYVTSGVPQDTHAVAVVATDDTPTAWSLRFALADDIAEPLPIVAPLAQGAGAQLAAHLSFGAAVIWSRGVDVERGEQGLAQTVTLRATLPSTGPALQSASGVWALDLGAGHLATRASAAGREIEDGRRLVAPLASGGGAMAVGPGAGTASFTLEAFYVGNEAFSHMELVSIPVDVASIGLHIPSYAGRVSAGLGGSLWIAGCSVPGDALADDPITCVREL